MVVGRPGQRRVLGGVVGVPDDPGVILGRAPVVTQLVLLKGQDVPAAAPGQPVGRGAADAADAQDDVLVGAVQPGVLPRVERWADYQSVNRSAGASSGTASRIARPFFDICRKAGRAVPRTGGAAAAPGARAAGRGRRAGSARRSARSGSAGSTGWCDGPAAAAAVRCASPAQSRNVLRVGSRSTRPDRPAAGPLPRAAARPPRAGAGTAPARRPRVSSAQQAAPPSATVATARCRPAAWRRAARSAPAPGRPHRSATSPPC